MREKFHRTRRQKRSRRSSIHLFAIGAGINGVAPVPVFDPSNGRPVTDVAGNIIYQNQQVQFNEAA